MCSQQYYGYALFCVLLMCWALQVDYRNEDFPQVQDVVVDTAGNLSRVQYQISNPSWEVTRVATHVRLQANSERSAESALFSSPVTIVKYDLQPRSTLDISLPVENVGLWSEANVQLYVLDDSIEIDEARLDRLGQFSTSRITFDRLQELFK